MHGSITLIDAHRHHGCGPSCLEFAGVQTHIRILLAEQQYLLLNMATFHRHESLSVPSIIRKCSCEYVMQEQQSSRPVNKKAIAKSSRLLETIRTSMLCYVGEA